MILLIVVLFIGGPNSHRIQVIGQYHNMEQCIPYLENAIYVQDVVQAECVEVKE